MKSAVPMQDIVSKMRSFFLMEMDDQSQRRVLSILLLIRKNHRSIVIIMFLMHKSAKYIIDDSGIAFPDTYSGR